MSPPGGPGATGGASESRKGPYAAAAIVGTIVGETVTANGLIFALPLVPPGRRVLVGGLLLALGFTAGAATGVLLLRRWYRRRHAAARPR